MYALAKGFGLFVYFCFFLKNKLTGQYTSERTEGNCTTSMKVQATYDAILTPTKHSFLLDLSDALTGSKPKI